MRPRAHPLSTTAARDAATSTGETATAGRQTFMVEYYRPGLDGDEMRHMAERIRDAVIALARAGKPIRHINSAVVPEDNYFQATFEATSAGLVHEAHERAGISFERISVAIPIDETE